MTRTPTGSRRGAKQTSTDTDASTLGAPRRTDRLAEVVDLCTEAKRIAEQLDERLLAYLLAMAIQETRAGMRQEVTIAADLGKAPLRTRR